MMDSEHLHEDELVTKGGRKIRFPLGEIDCASGVEAENLWAEAIDEYRYRVDNIPFYVYGVSLNDVVHAINCDGQLLFQDVALHCGHSTYRVILVNDSDALNPRVVALWTQLHALGCARELAKARVMAIDVPPSTNIYDVYAILERGEDQGIWSFEEGHCGHSV